MKFNETLKKFGYPDSMLKMNDSWYLLLRPEQTTLGSLILFSKDNQSKFSDLPKRSFTDMQIIIGEMERVLYNDFDCRKINYLMLMMVDPFVHFHIIPRYDVSKEVLGMTFKDPGWPGLPDFNYKNIIPKDKAIDYHTFIKSNYSA